MNAIELNHVAKRYGDFALEDVNLTLPQGCVLGLIGENGAGKSTLIRMMLGACRPDGGEVRVLGEKAGRTATFTKVRQDIGVVLDEACLPDELTAQQVGKVMHGIYANWDDAAFSSLCARLDLPKGKKVKDFSRGTKMKLAIAVALSHKAKLLVLDEATGGLDPVVRDEILDLLNDFTREEEHAILLSSHILTEIAACCTRLVVLSSGHLVADDTPDGLIRRVFPCEQWLLEADASAEALETLLSALPSLTRIVPHENGVLLNVPRGQDLHVPLFETLSKANCPIRRLERLNPNLEDIFLSLTHDDRYKEHL